MKNFLPLFLIFIALNTFSQKEANFWYFGRNAGLDFSSDEPIALTDGLLNTDEGCSTISDKDGNLLFYTDGIVLYNKDHQIVRFSNGTLANNLTGNPSSTQSALFVPNPTDENIYYLFTVGTDFVGDLYDPNPGFNYYTLDKSSGEIIAGPINLAGNLSRFWSEKVTAVEGNDCDSIWIVSAVGSQFYSYEITGNGINITPVISSTNYQLRDKRGYLKVSPDGSKMALADFNYTGTSGSGSLVLYDFNNQTGEISSSAQILTNPFQDGAPYGVEFSQNSSKLYTSTFDGRNNSIYQFDLTESDIASTKTQIFSQNGRRGALQLASNGKIYVSIPGNTSLDVIENPNERAVNITYRQASVSLGGRVASQGLPPFIQSFFSPVNIIDSNSVGQIVALSDTTQELCTDETLSLEPELPGNATTTYLWTKEGDPSVNSTNRVFSIDNNLGSGIYYLEMVNEDACGRQKTFNSSIEINFNDLPTVNTIDVFEQCDFDDNRNDFTTNFNLTILEPEIYSGTEQVTIEFFEVSDTSFSTPINKNNYINIVPTDAVNGNHKIIAKVTNTNSQCYSTTEVELKVNPSGTENYKDIYTCELDVNANIPNSISSNGSGNAFYNFDVKTNQIIANSMGSLSTSTHDFKYYRTRNDAILLNNEIEQPFETTLFTDNDDIFVRVTLKGSRDCESIGQFKIRIRALPIPQGNTNTEILCIKNPIENPQLESINLNADTGTATDTYKWYLNGVEIFGENNAILAATKEGTYKVEAIRNYENDVADTTDDTVCIGYNTFTVKESNKAVIESVSFLDDQDKTADNTITIKVSGIGDYEYALNDNSSTNFVKGTDNLSYTFTNVPPGLNTVYIRDINGCGVVSSQEISFVYFQRHFTPNEDGNFDTWKVQGIDNSFYTEVNLQIFDRYGKLLKVINQKTENGWNGILNGKMMPSNDYWYNAVLIDKNGKTRKKTGHFSLIRKQ
ncbi:T9SS type B sorting domain-containing protein [Polaribacter batillariae]|uniref:T9SS type B sorting domain-containing protein n=1 Tax=Polaribacter batillariae TaxID=2808900 RepID=A0ABX7SZ64_9FLAO|nr:T9SS type B sorting domain-containing protein [Polaribacter batillariae]QTD38296.1 T9SS type B sorting domain-containing protein [Polaribacter batillariae]